MWSRTDFPSLNPAWLGGSFLFISRAQVILCVIIFPINLLRQNVYAIRRYDSELPGYLLGLSMGQMAGGFLMRWYVRVRKG